MDKGWLGLSAVHLILTVYLVYRPNWACDEEYYFHRDIFFGRFLNELCRFTGPEWIFVIPLLLAILSLLSALRILKLPADE